MNKIFGIGLPRTGTLSLTDALNLLGFPSVHWVREEEFEGALAAFRGITDLPVPARYPALDRRFPGSKFILTRRDVDSWLDSCASWFSARPADARRRGYRLEMFGAAEFDADAWTRVYRRHQEEVTAYFRGREGDLLTMDILGGEGWERLAPFFGMAVPPSPFPHRNKRD